MTSIRKLVGRLDRKTSKGIMLVGMSVAKKFASSEPIQAIRRQARKVCMLQLQTRLFLSSSASTAESRTGAGSGTLHEKILCIGRAVVTAHKSSNHAGQGHQQVQVPGFLCTATSSFGSPSTCSTIRNRFSATSTVFRPQSRNFSYFPRKDWGYGRRKQVYARKRQSKNARNLQPRYMDKAKQREQVVNSEKGSYIYRFRQRQIRVSLKRLQDYGRLVTNRNLQDGIDFLESMGRPHAEPIIECLRNARENLTVFHGKDPARLVVQTFQCLRGRYVKSIKYKAMNKVGICRHPRNHILVGVREMSLEEFFQKVYVVGKVPTTLTWDMRLALFEGRCGPEMHRHWSPYLTSTSRWLHRKRLKYLDATKQLDFYKLRDEWIARYQGNWLRKTREARSARGLSEIKI
ncbi:unnamed protein product [Amoebophrya sp. A120]|nr:unnamed protein product [Amoebophrya sp. A120]|eukprot:GSA120T00003629001.1